MRAALTGAPNQAPQQTDPFNAAVEGRPGATQQPQHADRQRHDRERVAEANSDIAFQRKTVYNVVPTEQRDVLVHGSYQSDITRGLVTWQFAGREIRGARRLDRLNPQTQEFTVSSDDDNDSDD